MHGIRVRWRGRPYPTFARYSTVERAACDGALSCMKIIFFLNAERLLRYQGKNLFWIKFRYVSAFIFTPSGTLNRPNKLIANYPSPKYVTTTSLLSSHSWWFAAALYKPTSAPAIWSIEGCSALICGKNGLEVCLAHFLALSSRWFLCLVVKGGWILCFTDLPIVLRIRQRVVLVIPLTPACSNITCLLVKSDCFTASRLMADILIWRLDIFRFTPLSHLFRV